MKTIILDTDIGTDIDDAFALAYLIKKQCALAGVTTVYRNTRKRAELAKAIAESMGAADIKVYAGINQPFVQSPEKIEPPQCKQHYDQSGQYIPPQCAKEFERCTVEKEHAVEFIIRTCENNEITDILCIGALTNIAAAFRIAPHIIKDVRLTVMGGCLKKLSLGGEEPHPVAEWNILCDPEAAHIVFSSGAEIRLVGLDVTMDVPLKAEQYEDLKKANVCPVLGDLVSKWAAYYGAQTPVLYDPVAAVSMFTDCLTFEEKRLSVGLEGENRGVLSIDPQGSPLQYAVSRNNKVFYEEFLSTLKTFPKGT